MSVGLKVFSLTGKSKLSTYISECESFPPCPPCLLIGIVYRPPPFSLLFCVSQSSEEWGRGQYTQTNHWSTRLLCTRTRKKPQLTGRKLWSCGCHGGVCLCIACTIIRNTHGFSNKDAKNELIFSAEVYITPRAHLETRLNACIKSTSGKSCPPV